MISTIIVDDEPLARERLRTLAAGAGDLKVVAECGDGLSAVRAIEEHRPDLIFLDIQMPEMDGFEVLQALDAPAPATIFVTAYDRYAVRAFDVAAVDYLLKPINPERFHAAVARAGRRAAASAERRDVLTGILEQLGARHRQAERFVVRNGDQLSFVKVADVEWIEATGNYVRLFAGGRTHIVRETMKSLDQRLDPGSFVRIHRSVIIHIDRIDSLEPHFHGEWIITMRDGTRFTSGRTYSERVRALLR